METCKDIGTCTKIHNGQHNYYSASRENKWTKKNIRVDILYLGKYLSISKYLSVLLQHWQVPVYIYTDTILASICLNCFLIGMCLPELLPHWQVSVYTVTTLVSIFNSLCIVTTLDVICLHFYHTGKYQSVLLLDWQVSVCTVTTLANIFKC